MVGRLHDWFPAPAWRILAGVAFTLASLGLAFALLWWTRGIAIPLLFLAGAWYWLLRPPGPLSGRERVLVKGWGLLSGFFLFGPIVVPAFRLALLAVLVLVAFQPGGRP